MKKHKPTTDTRDFERKLNNLQLIANNLASCNNYSRGRKNFKKYNIRETAIFK